MGIRKNGRVTPSRVPVLPFAHYFQAPATQAMLTSFKQRTFFLETAQNLPSFPIHMKKLLTKELQMRHNFEKSILSAPFPRTTFLTWCKWTLTVFSWCPRKTTKLPNLHEQVFQGKTCFCIPRDLGSATGSVISFNELASGNVQWQYTEKTWLKESCAKTIN